MMRRLLLICATVFAGLCMSAQVTGNPSVDYTIDEVGTDFITITFTPNADAAGYAVCLFDAGTAQQQFEMWGAWMGFETMGDMIRAWGVPQTGTYQHTWTNQNPGSDYEIYVQCWDVNNIDADMIIIPVTTLSMGGEGLAEMTIEIGEFGGSEETGFYQWVIYTPNENVSMHRDMIIEQDAYVTEEWGEENILEYLKADNPFDPYWNQYGVDEAQWTANPGTWYIAFSIAQNSLGEWGPLASVTFKTPGTTGINEIAMNKAQFNMDGNQINATGMNAGSVLRVLDMNGRVVAQTRVNADGEATVVTNDLARGVYIVTDGKTAKKFMK